MDLLDRARSLEEQFFIGENQRLLEQMRQKAEIAARRESLLNRFSADFAQHADNFSQLDLRPETLSVLQLYPLVHIAWADQKVEPEEVQAILKAFDESSLSQFNPLSRELLMSWLRTPPNDELFKTWAAYMQELRKKMAPPSYNAFVEKLLDDAIAVAQAAGGFLNLGIGSKISKYEKEALLKLKEVVF